MIPCVVPLETWKETIHPFLDKNVLEMWYHTAVQWYRGSEVFESARGGRSFGSVQHKEFVVSLPASYGHLKILESCTFPTKGAEFPVGHYCRKEDVPFVSLQKVYGWPAGEGAL